MSYYDPYQEFYGDFEPYEEPSPPEPSPDWEDVPKTNRSYLRKIPKNVVQEQFNQLLVDQIYDIDILVESIELNEYYIQPQDKENNYEHIVVSLKLLNLPFADLLVSKKDRKTTTVVSGRTVSKVGSKHNTVGSDRSVTRTVTRTNTVSSEKGGKTTVVGGRSATALAGEGPSLAQYFQKLLLYLAKTAAEAPKEEETGGDEDNNEQTEEGTISRVATQDEGVEDSKAELHKIDTMRGKSMLLMTNGYTMLQKLQSQDIRISVGRRVVTESEEDEETTDVEPLGSGRVVGFPDAFFQAVLRQGATEQLFKLPLWGEQEEEVGLANFTVKFACLGKGVEATISGDPDAEPSIKLMKSFPPEAVKSIFDPPVHPRLAVTIMNLDPPPGLNRTSSEIIRLGLEKGWILLEDEAGPLNSKFNPRKCRWLDLAKEISGRYSVASLGSGSIVSHTQQVQQHPTRTATTGNSSKTINFVNVALPGHSDPDIRPLWREIKRKCANLREEAEQVEKKRRTLFEELEKLLREDKGDGWEDEVTSKISKSSKSPQEEDQTSSSSKRSGKSSLRKSTLRQSLRQ